MLRRQFTRQIKSIHFVCFMFCLLQGCTGIDPESRLLVEAIPLEEKTLEPVLVASSSASALSKPTRTPEISPLETVNLILATETIPRADLSTSTPVSTSSYLPTTFPHSTPTINDLCYPWPDSIHNLADNAWFPWVIRDGDIIMDYSFSATGTVLWDFTPRTGRLAYGMRSNLSSPNDLWVNDYSTGLKEQWFKGDVIAAK